MYTQHIFKNPKNGILQGTYFLSFWPPVFDLPLYPEIYSITQ